MKAALLFIVGIAASAALGFETEADEMHFGVSPGARVISIQVVEREEKLWRLFPDDVKVAHEPGSREYVLSYERNAAPARLLTSAENAMSTACRAEAAKLLDAPDVEVSEEKISTTIYVELDPKSPLRLSARAEGGLRIVDIRSFRSEAPPDGQEAKIEPWSRALYVHLNYARPSTLGAPSTSDISVKRHPKTGQYEFKIMKPGSGALSQLQADGLLSNDCWAQIDKTGWGGKPFSIRGLFSFHHLDTVLVLPLDPKDADRVSAQVSGGLSLKGIGALE